MLIVFSGLPGTGKSALAEKVARRLGVAWLSVDPIESAIVGAGIRRGFETGLAAYRVVEVVAEAQLASGQSVVVDAVNAVEEAKATWRDLASRRDVRLAIVECRCSDEALHRRRLEARRRELPGIPEPTWEAVRARRLEYTAWDRPLLAVDAADSLDGNTARVLAWLERDPG